jgi:VWFA-related protein
MKFAILLFCCAGVLSAQPSSVIRTETREVLVDAVVTGKNGAYVGDLSAKDFRIWQDGKEQAIRGFSVESPTTNEQTRSLVLFFDETSMEARDQIAARLAASRFVDAEAGPHHRMAIVVYNGSLRIAQSFTDNPGRLKDALNQAAFHGLAPSAADSDRSHDPSRREEDRLVGRAGGNAAAVSFEIRNMIRSLGQLGTSLGVLPGRKIVVLFTGALASSSDQRPEVREAVDEANKSGVAIYAVDVRPVFSQADTGNSPTPDTRPAFVQRGGGPGGGPQGDADPLSTPVQDAGAAGQSILFNLANGTGGFVVANTSDVLAGLQSIGKEQDQYYVLTYEPPESKEGSCHTLKVKLDRKQTNVRSRTTYCTEKPLDLLAGTTAGKELERRAEASQTGDIGASIQLPYFYAAPNVARVDVAMEIQADKLKFENRKGKFHAELNFLGVAAGADGQVHARFSDAMKLDFDDPAQVENLKGKYLNYEKEFKIAPGEYNLTVAFSQGGESFGKVQAPLKVDPWNSDLALSGLALGTEAHPADDLGLAPALEGRTPLVSDGVQVVPSGFTQFSRSKPAFLYFEIYGPQAANAQVRVRAVDRGTGGQKWDGGLLKLPSPAPGQSTVSAGMRLPLDSLAPGLYRLEVTAADSTGKQVKRTTDFEVDQ